MVPNEPEGASHMEDEDVPLCEGFHWDSVADFSPVSAFSRKRSMSESSVVTHGTTTSCPVLRATEPTSVTNLRDSGKPRLQAVHSPMEEDFDQRHGEGITQEKEHMKTMEVQMEVQDTEPMNGESSCMSSAELNGGKKRRAVGVSDCLSFFFLTDNMTTNSGCKYECNLTFFLVVFF